MFAWAWRFSRWISLMAREMDLISFGRRILMGARWFRTGVGRPDRVSSWSGVSW